MNKIPAGATHCLRTDEPAGGRVIGYFKIEDGRVSRWKGAQNISGWGGTVYHPMNVLDGRHFHPLDNKDVIEAWLEEN